MRKILIVLVVIVTMSILWIWRGRDLSMLVDRFKTRDGVSTSITSIQYEDAETGGRLTFLPYGFRLNLAVAEPRVGLPHIGSTKDNQMALANAGKVFVFGPLQSPDTVALAANLPATDMASIVWKDSLFAWPNPKFMINRLPLWNRNRYWHFICKKENGARLELVWRFEQHFDSHATMTNYDAPGLIRVEISN